MRHSRRPGFTLLELMLSMMVVVMAAVTLAASLTIAFKARETGEHRVATARTMELVMESLRADIQCALPPSRGRLAGAFEGSNQQIDNNIEADDLNFFAATPAPYHPEGSNGDIKQFEFTCYQPNNSTDHILVRRTLNNLLPPNGTALVNPDEEILCRNVLGFTLQYFDGTEWQPIWDSTQNNNSLPLAVMVTLSIASSELDVSGKPLPVTRTRIFQLPCIGAPSGAISGIASGSSTGKKQPTPSKGGAK